MKRLLVAVLLLVGCGTQYSDPIRRVPAMDVGAAGASGAAATASDACLDEPVWEFPGANFATMARTVQDDFTIEVWLKTSESLSGTGAYVGNPVVFADVPALTKDDFGAAILNGKFQMTVGNPDTAVRSTSDVAIDEWVHVAATRTRASGIVLVFVNGVLEGIGTGNTNALSASATMSIGGRAGRDFFVGLMSELRIWSTARSQSEILANMHRRLQGNEAGLVGYYRLDDAPGETLRDASASENHATLDSASAPVASDPPVCGP